MPHLDNRIFRLKRSRANTCLLSIDTLVDGKVLPIYVPIWFARVRIQPSKRQDVSWRTSTLISEAAHDQRNRVSFLVLSLYILSLKISLSLVSNVVSASSSQCCTSILLISASLSSFLPFALARLPQILPRYNLNYVHHSFSTRQLSFSLCLLARDYLTGS